MQSRVKFSLVCLLWACSASSAPQWSGGKKRWAQRAWPPPSTSSLPTLWRWEDTFLSLNLYHAYLNCTSATRANDPIFFPLPSNNEDYQVPRKYHELTPLGNVQFFSYFSEDDLPHISILFMIPPQLPNSGFHSMEDSDKSTVSPREDNYKSHMTLKCHQNLFRFSGRKEYDALRERYPESEETLFLQGACLAEPRLPLGRHYTTDLPNPRQVLLREGSIVNVQWRLRGTYPPLIRSPWKIISIINIQRQKERHTSKETSAGCLAGQLGEG